LLLPLVVVVGMELAVAAERVDFVPAQVFLLPLEPITPLPLALEEREVPPETLGAAPAITLYLAPSLLLVVVGQEVNRIVLRQTLMVLLAALAVARLEMELLLLQQAAREIRQALARAKETMVETKYLADRLQNTLLVVAAALAVQVPMGH